jgi:hypothetical protein
MSADAETESVFCADCGYERRDVAGSPCPECGAAYPSAVHPWYVAARTKLTARHVFTTYRHSLFDRRFGRTLASVRQVRGRSLRIWCAVSLASLFMSLAVVHVVLCINRFANVRRGVAMQRREIRSWHVAHPAESKKARGTTSLDAYVNARYRGPSLRNLAQLLAAGPVLHQLCQLEAALGGFYLLWPLLVLMMLARERGPIDRRASLIAIHACDTYSIVIPVLFLVVATDGYFAGNRLWSGTREPILWVAVIVQCHLLMRALRLSSATRVSGAVRVALVVASLIPPALVVAMSR